ncbi:mechanosensitive ion channel [Salinifilum aidingensis]
MELPDLSQPKCVEDVGSWCHGVFRMTGNEWLAASADFFLAKPFKILLILVVAYTVRWAVHRVITRMTQPNGHTPKLLQPLKERSDVRTSAALSERRLQRARTIGSVMKSVASLLILGLAVMYILQVLSVPIGPLLTSAGVLGIAVSFGAQNLVRDFLSGMFMLVEDQYGVGDWVDVGEATGTVEAVGLRVTTLRDVDGTVWYVRNGEILRVGNSSQGWAVAVLDLPISHSSDVQKAIEVAAGVAEEATQSDPLATDCLEPPQMLGVNQITADTITLRLTIKVRPGKQWTVQRQLHREIKRAYDHEDIKPPYPNGLPLGPGNRAHRDSTQP